MFFRTTITMPDLDAQIAKLAGFNRVWDKEVTQMQKGNALAMKKNWQMMAPHRTGAYRDSITDGVKRSQNEISAIASTSMRSAKGFPYPRALEESVRYHFRSTSRRGQRTAGQVVRMFRAMRPDLDMRAEATSVQILLQMVV